MLFGHMNTTRADSSSSIREFLSALPDTVLGELTRNCGFAIETSQRDAWLKQIGILQKQLTPWLDSGQLFFEFVAPRMGRRIDVLAIIRNTIFVIEFKVGETHFTRAALDQVWDYALDLKNFHEPSHHVTIAPILVATEANEGFSAVAASHHNDGVLMPIKTSPESLSACIEQVLWISEGPDINPDL